MIEKQPPRTHHHQNGYRKPCLFFHISWVLLGDVTQTGRTFKSYVCTVTSKRGWVTEVDGFSCSGPLLCIYSLLESQDSQYSDLSKCLRRGCSKGSRKLLNSRSLPQGEEIHLSKRSLWPPSSTKEKASMAGVGMCHADCGGWTASGGQLLQGPPQLERVAHPKNVLWKAVYTSSDWWWRVQKLNHFSPRLASSDGPYTHQSLPRFWSSLRGPAVRLDFGPLPSTGLNPS